MGAPDRFTCTLAICLSLIALGLSHPAVAEEESYTPFGESPAALDEALGAPKEVFEHETGETRIYETDTHHISISFQEGAAIGVNYLSNHNQENLDLPDLVEQMSLADITAILQQYAPMDQWVDGAFEEGQKFYLTRDGSLFAVSADYVSLAVYDAKAMPLAGKRARPHLDWVREMRKLSRGEDKPKAAEGGAPPADAQAETQTGPAE